MLRRSAIGARATTFESWAYNHTTHKGHTHTKQNEQHEYICTPPQHMMHLSTITHVGLRIRRYGEMLMLRAKASKRVRGPVWYLRRPRATYEARRGLAIACGGKGDSDVAGARGLASNVTELIPPHLRYRWSFTSCASWAVPWNPPLLWAGAGPWRNPPAAPGFARGTRVDARVAAYCPGRSVVRFCFGEAPHRAKHGGLCGTPSSRYYIII